MKHFTCIKLGFKTIKVSKVFNWFGSDVLNINYYGSKSNLAD